MKKRVFFLSLLALFFLNSCQKGDDTTVGDRITYSEQVPMLAWIGVPQGADAKQYQWLREAGFNYQLLSGYGSLRAVEDALAKSAAVGVKCLVACPEMNTDTEMAIKRLKDHPALAGYTTIDEPKMKDLDRVASLMKKYQSFDKKGISYVNLLSLDTSEKVMGASFDAYFKKATSVLPLQMLSCTFYPIVLRDGEAERRVNGLWYENLEVYSRRAKELKVPLWAFVLSASFRHTGGGGAYPDPTVADLRLQIYTNLAYGVQLLQYYTYSTPADAPHYTAPIKADGSKSASYERIKQVNQEVIALSGVFVGAQVVDVWHTGKTLPKGTKALKVPKPFKGITTGDGGAVVSHLRNGGRNYLMIVNHSCTKGLSVRIEASAGVKEVSKEARLKEVDWSEARRYEIGAGDMELFEWEGIND